MMSGDDRGNESKKLVAGWGIALLAVFLVVLILWRNIGLALCALWFPTFFMVIALVGFAEERWGFWGRFLIVGLFPISSMFVMLGVAMSLPGTLKARREARGLIRRQFARFDPTRRGRNAKQSQAASGDVTDAG